MTAKKVFVTGGTGHIGRSLIAELLKRGHSVEVLVRPGSEKKCSPGCIVRVGDPLNRLSFESYLTPDQTFVQLVGISHPNPAKKDQFRDIDFKSGQAAVEAAAKVGIGHFVYLSVAQPAPIMKDYIQVRKEVEALIAERQLKATIVRPWYVIGPGRRWPLILSPLYWILKRFEKTRPSALRLGFVTTQQMTTALVSAIENPPGGIRLWEVPDIRREGTPT